MPSLKIPAPIVKTVLNTRSGNTIGRVTKSDTPIEIEILTETEAPIAVAYRLNNADYVIRSEKGTGRFWHRQWQRLPTEDVTIDQVWDDDLFGLRFLTIELTHIHTVCNGGMAIDSTLHWRLPKPSRQEKFLESDLSERRQIDAIVANVVRHRVIDGAIYTQTVEPLAIASGSNPTPMLILSSADSGYRYDDTLMIYSMRDWPAAQRLVDRVGEKHFDDPRHFEVDLLEPTAFGPADRRYQKAVFLRRFSIAYHGHLAGLGENAAVFLDTLTEEDTTWLGNCAACLEKAHHDEFDDELLDTTVDYLLSGKVGTAVASLISSWGEFGFVTDALRSELGLKVRA